MSRIDVKLAGRQEVYGKEHRKGEVVSVLVHDANSMIARGLATKEVSNPANEPELKVDTTITQVQPTTSKSTKQFKLNKGATK